MAEKRPMSAARILYTTDNITTGEKWACIETVNGNLASPITTLGVPARYAETVVALINDAHRHLTTALSKYVADDPAWRGHLSRVALATDELQRIGRPRASKEAMVQYAQKHGTDAAARKFNVTAGTLDTYRRRIEKQRRQK